MYLILDSLEEEEYSDRLACAIEELTDNPDPDWIAKIRSLWDGESWESIQKKSQVEESTWYVWWMDGVRAFVHAEKNGYPSTVRSIVMKRGPIMDSPWIKVNEGNMFEGNFGHWEDVFFSFPDHFTSEDKLTQIRSFCMKSNYRLEVSKETPAWYKGD
jgi:hypothetical protein